MDVDEALRVVGGYRPYHMTIFVLVCFSSFLPANFLVLCYVFIGWTPPHHCAIPANQTKDDVIPKNSDGTYSSCTMYVDKSVDNTTQACTSWTYDSGGYETIVTEFDLVCDDMFLTDLTQILLTAGAIVTDTTCSYFTDKYGRRRMHIFGQYLIAALGLCVTFSPTYIALLVFRILLGVSHVVNMNSGLTLLTELFDSEKRAVAGISLNYGWTVSYLLPIPLAYLITDWRVFSLIGSLLPLIFTIYFCILPESPGWLVAYERYEQAETWLNRMARWNRVRAPPVTISRTKDPIVVTVPLISQKTNSANDVTTSLDNNNTINSGSAMNGEKLPEQRDQLQTPPAEASKEKIPILKILADSKLRLHLCLANMFSFASVFVYYALVLNASSYGNRFVTYFLMGVAEIPAYVVALLVVNRIGRRLPMVAFYCLAGVCLLLSLFVDKDSEWGSIILVSLVFVARFAVSGEFAVMLLFVRELFPTEVRSSSVAWGGIGGGIGFLLAPVFVYIGKLKPWLPNLILGIVSMVAALGVIPLPETKNKPLPLTVAELHDIYYPKHVTKKQMKSLEMSPASKNNA